MKLYDFGLVIWTSICGNITIKHVGDKCEKEVCTKYSNNPPHELRISCKK